MFAAAKKLSPEAYESFLDNSYLGDGVTTIRLYLEKNPDILEEVPPPVVAKRYGGV